MKKYLDTRILAAFLIVLIAIAVNLYAEKKHSNVYQSWVSYADQASKIDVLMIELNQNLGYGGFIHYFKNLILRKDIDSYSPKIEEKIQNLRRVLTELENSVSNRSDHINLLVIRNTVEEYVSNYYAAKKMIQSGETSNAIDRVVRVDDSMAFKAAETLKANIYENLNTTKTELEAKFDEAVFITWIGEVFMFLSLIIAGILVYHYQKTTKQLLDNSLIYKTILSSAQIGTWQLDASKTDSVEWDEVTRLIHQIPKDFQITMEAAINFYKEGSNRERITQLVQESIATGSPYKAEFEIVTFKGDHRWVLVQGFPLYENGKLKRLYGLIEDISNEKNAELSVIQSRDEAIQANKAKSEFLSSMSHELRTPLNAVIGFSQLLEFDTSLSAGQKKHVCEINRAGNHLLRLINDVLDLSAIEAGKLQVSIEHVNIEMIGESALSMLKPLAEKRDIEIELQNLEGINVRADYIRLKQAIINLMSNAIKYNHQGGKVTVKAENLGKLARISVTDNGYGIEENKLKYLFESFNRLGREGSDIEGSGIGLALTQQLIELMNGKLGVESVINEGSCFWIELPLDNTVIRPLDNTAHQLPSENNNIESKTVLYIEDNPANLKLMEAFFEQFSHLQLITAHRPNLGLELANSEQPELILLDINLPQMDGYQVLSQLQQNSATTNIPVIAITANAMPKDIETGKKAGFKDYLTKPLDLTQLEESISNFT